MRFGVRTVPVLMGMHRVMGLKNAEINQMNYCPTVQELLLLLLFTIAGKFFFVFKIKINHYFFIYRELEFPCILDAKCISNDLVCDGNADCKDESDETVIQCANFG